MMDTGRHFAGLVPRIPCEVLVCLQTIIFLLLTLSTNFRRDKFESQYAYLRFEQLKYHLLAVKEDIVTKPACPGVLHKMLKVGCEVRSTTTLLEYLRHHLELRGTKYKCLEGGCGSCIVSAVKCHGDKPQGVNSCMVSITSCKDWEITTIEKVGNRLDGYHPLQTTLAAKGGSQCGYCSPGMIMNIYSYLKAKPRTMREIEHALGSNLCRCTGYRPILEAFKTFASDAPKPTDILDIEDLKICKKSGESCSGLKCEHSDWCIVPKHNEVLHIKLSDDRDWYRVASLIDVFNIWEKNGTECYMLINGNTGKGVYPILEYPKLLIDISGVSELKGYYIDQNLVLLGGTTLVEVLHIFKTLANNEGFCYLNVLADHLEKVAHVTVRNGLLRLCPPNIVKPIYSSGAIKLSETRPVSKSLQVFETDPTLWPLNEPIPKIEGVIQCAGEAKYADDTPSLPREVFVDFVLAKVPLGTIKNIDPSIALVGVNSRGEIQHLKSDLFSDNGYIYDEPLMLLGIDVNSNCYSRERWTHTGYNAVTDTASNTWVRSPSTLEHIAMAELIMERIAYELNLDALDVRFENLDKVKHSELIEMTDTLKKNSQYDERKAAVDEFNKNNRWKKRGLRFSLLRWPLFGFLNLEITMSVFADDGTVIITHGGVEMGQGVNTKAIQIAAYFLKIPINKIQVKPNDTSINPNCFISGGSLTSQNVGIGVRKCCEQLLERLEPIQNKMQNPPWTDLIRQAYIQQVDLQVHYYTNLTNSYQMYDVHGATLAEVEFDVLTGEHTIIRVDLIEDVGRSVNPDIDVGQVSQTLISVAPLIFLLHNKNILLHACERVFTVKKTCKEENMETRQAYAAEKGVTQTFLKEKYFGQFR
ncbi:jg18399 [Pararge aegeria aegeria]|uniref:Jg18399 protein n=1 Tax=Pararge aegeria aegeria TaxID=348720 RepID=A0A8S4R847_9NEOP|nr:jg18399 [Pararge aegeria aegeria]